MEIVLCFDDLPSFKEQRKPRNKIACTNCKRMKLRCSDQRPCLRCLESDKGSSCFDVPDKRRKKQDSASVLESPTSPISKLESLSNKQSKRDAPVRKTPTEKAAIAKKRSSEAAVILQMEKDRLQKVLEVSTSRLSFNLAPNSQQQSQQQQHHQQKILSSQSNSQPQPSVPHSSSQPQSSSVKHLVFHACDAQNHSGNCESDSSHSEAPFHDSVQCLHPSSYSDSAFSSAHSEKFPSSDSSNLEFNFAFNSTRPRSSSSAESQHSPTSASFGSVSEMPPFVPSILRGPSSLSCQSCSSSISEFDFNFDSEDSFGRMDTSSSYSHDKTISCGSFSCGNDCTGESCITCNKSSCLYINNINISININPSSSSSDLMLPTNLRENDPNRYSADSDDVLSIQRINTCLAGLSTAFISLPSEETMVGAETVNKDGIPQCPCKGHGHNSYLDEDDTEYDLESNQNYQNIQCQSRDYDECVPSFGTAPNQFLLLHKTERDGATDNDNDDDEEEEEEEERKFSSYSEQLKQFQQQQYQLSVLINQHQNQNQNHNQYVVANQLRHQQQQLQHQLQSAFVMSRSFQSLQFPTHGCVVMTWRFGSGNLMDCNRWFKQLFPRNLRPEIDSKRFIVFGLVPKVLKFRVAGLLRMLTIMNIDEAEIEAVWVVRGHLRPVRTQFQIQRDELTGKPLYLTSWSKICWNDPLKPIDQYFAPLNRKDLSPLLDNFVAQAASLSSFQIEPTATSSVLP